MYGNNQSFDGTSKLNQNLKLLTATLDKSLVENKSQLQTMYESINLLDFKDQFEFAAENNSCNSVILPYYIKLLNFLELSKDLNINTLFSKIILDMLHIDYTNEIDPSNKCKSVIIFEKIFPIFKEHGFKTVDLEECTISRIICDISGIFNKIQNNMFTDFLEFIFGSVQLTDRFDIYYTRNLTQYAKVFNHDNADKSFENKGDLNSIDDISEDDIPEDDISQKILNFYNTIKLIENKNGKLIKLKDLYELINKLKEYYIRIYEGVVGSDTCYLVPVTILFNQIVEPKLMNQNNANLCVVSSYLSILARTRPYLLINMAIELITTGEINKPFKLKSIKCDPETPLLTQLMDSIRNYFNTLGYSRNTFGTLFELFRGATRPSEVCKWLTQSGYEVIDQTLLRDSNNNVLKTNYLNLYDKKNHKTFDTIDENIQAASESLDKGQQVLLFIGSLFNFSTMKLSTKKSSTLLGVMTAHCVNLTKLTMSGSTVTLGLDTYGKSYNFTLHKDVFRKIYQGVIIATPTKNYNSMACYPKSVNSPN